MSFQAMAWASGTKENPMSWGGPSARAAIYAITNHADDNWFCRTKQETLALESEQSADSIQRRIQEFIAAGMVRRIKLKRFGRRTFDFLILKPSPYFTAPLEVIEPFIPRGCEIMSDDDAAADCGSSELADQALPPQDSETNATADCGSVSDMHNFSALPQPADDATAIVRQPEDEPILNLESSPPKPPQATEGQAIEGGEDQKKREAALADLAEFRAAYPEPSNRPHEVEAAVLSQPPEKRLRLIRGAKGVAAARRANPRKAILDAAKFARDEALWAEYERLAPAEAIKAPPRAFEAEGSQSWRARNVIAEICGTMPPYAQAFEEGRGRKFALALSSAELALARFADDDPETWPLAKEGSRECGAWKRFLGIGSRLFVVGRKRYEMARGRFIDDWPIKEEGLRVPCDWPPGKDGKIYSTGPPETLLTADDVAKAV